MTSVAIVTPDDFHVHLREGVLLQPLVEATARHFRRALVMPNTQPPIATARDAMRYRGEILTNCSYTFEPLMTIKLLPTTTRETIEEAQEAGIVAGKLYPEGVTTNSTDGVRDLAVLSLAFEAMEEADIVLCIHCEAPGAFCMDREEAFLDSVREIVANFPRLRVVLEHVSTAEAVDFVFEQPEGKVSGTVTVHHLVLTLDDVIGHMLEPHHFCKPLPKRPSDRERLVKAATQAGQTRFFLGTDSAPHLRSAKEGSAGAAGVFSALTALPVLATIFEREVLGEAWWEVLEQFASANGADFYRLPRNEEAVDLIREPWEVPMEWHGVVPFGAGRKVSWKAKRR